MSEAATPTTESAPQKPNWSLLASEAFGDQYKGEVKTPEPEKAAETPDTAPPKPDDTAPDEPEQAPAEAQDKQDTEVPVTSFEELAQKFELDPDWLNTLAIPVKINGAEGKATLADLTKSYQTFEAAEQRLAEVKEKSKAETQRLQQEREQLNAHYSVVASLIDHTEKLITKDFANVNWDQLRVQDPAEFSAKKAELTERQNELANMKRQAVDSYQSAQAKAKQDADTNLQQYLAQERDALLTKLPEWKDPEKASAEKRDIATYLIGAGFSKEDISAANDHRMILLARKAMLYDTGQNKAEVVKKKFTSIPKVLKPGAPKSPDQINQQKMAEAQARLRKSGSIEDALAVLRSKQR